MGFLLNRLFFDPTGASAGNLLLGGSASLVPALAFGPWHGLVAALLAAAGTAASPAAVAVIALRGLEGLLLGWLVVRRRLLPVFASLLYWVLLGGPLLFAIADGVPGEARWPAWGTAADLCLGGLLQVLLAEIVLDTAVGRWLCGSTAASQRPLRQHLAHAAALAVAVPPLVALAAAAPGYARSPGERTAWLLIALGIPLLSAFRLLNRLARPIAELAAAAEQLERGTVQPLAIAAGGSSPAEVSRLAHDFEAMVTQLRDSYAALYASVADRERLIHHLEDARAARDSASAEQTADLERQLAALRLLEGVASAANAAATSEEAIESAIELVCTHTGWPVGHAYTLADDTSDVLVPTSCWHLAEPERFEAFRRAAESVVFPAGEGLPRQVLASERAAWIQSVAIDSSFLSTPVAVELGLEWAAGFPVLAGSRVAAVLEFFAPGPQPTDPALLHLMASVGAQLSLVIERKQAEKALVDSEERYRVVAEAAPAAILTMNDEGTIVFANRVAEAVFGYPPAELIGHPLTLLMFRTLEGASFQHYLSSSTGGLDWSGVELVGRARGGAEVPIEVAFGEHYRDGHRFFTGFVRDISERKRAEVRLRDERERAQRYLNIVGAIVLALDDRGHVTLINQHGCQVLGLAAAAIVGNPWWHFIPRSERQPAAARHARTVTGRAQPVADFESSVVTANGETRQIVWNTVLLRDAEGSIQGTLSSGVDVTERRRAETRLAMHNRILADVARRAPPRETLEQLALLVEAQAPRCWVSVLLLEDGRLTLGAAPSVPAGYRAGLADLLVWAGDADQEPSAPAGDEGGELTVPDSAHRTLAASHGLHVCWSQPVRHGSSGEILGALTLYSSWPPALDENGALLMAAAVGLAAMVIEAAQAESAEQRLRATIAGAAAEWMATFDAADSAIVVADRNARVLRLNRAALELSGGGFQDCVGRLLPELGSGDPWRTAAGLVPRALTEGATQEASGRDAATGRSWSIAASPIGGAAQRVVVIVKEITALLALQESLRRSELLSALGTLVVGVAHEVRNPLFGISGVVDACRAEFGSRPELVPFLDILQQQVRRLSDLMNDLLEYGRPRESSPRPGTLPRVVAEATEQCRALAEGRGVKIAARLPTGLPGVLMDEARLTGMLRNLLENAVQHSPPAGEVEVEAATLQADSRSWLECTVLDRGPGFSEADLPRLFEPFFTRRHGGTGLGLSIVQRVAEDHGGNVIAGNRPGGGAMLTVRLPAVVE